jgi:tetratricopeptide (TPR) repeat protein
LNKITKTCCVLFGLLVLLQLTGCQWAHKQTRSNNIVREHFEARDYDLVITNAIQYRLSKPKRTNAEENQYLLSRAYYETNNFYSAYSEFQKYLEKYPNGRYKNNTIEYLNEIYTQKAKSVSKTEKEKDLEQKIVNLKQEIAKDTENVELSMELAEAFWQLGEYDSAVQTYARVIELDPAMRRDALIQARLEFRPDGTVIGKAAGTSYTSEKGAAKLEFRDMNSYISRDPSAYHVTGRIKNNGDITATNVQVSVELFDIGSKIIDSKTEKIGKLIPQEERTFSIRFKNPGSSVENVRRYEYKAIYR